MRYVTGLLLTILILTGCTTVPSWDRGILARDDMALDSNPATTSLQQQIYTSKEGASGSAGLGGGGCGCN